MLPRLPLLLLQLTCANIHYWTWDIHAAQTLALNSAAGRVLLRLSDRSFVWEAHSRDLAGRAPLGLRRADLGARAEGGAPWAADFVPRSCSFVGVGTQDCTEFNGVKGPLTCIWVCLKSLFSLFSAPTSCCSCRPSWARPRPWARHCGAIPASENVELFILCIVGII